MKKLNFRKVKYVFLLLCVFILVIGFIMQGREVVQNPPITQDVLALPEVKAILKKSCYDCHSNETQITWLQKLPIVSFIVADDVEEARKKFNFSEWNKYSTDKQRELLFKAVTSIKDQEMPLSSYLLIHPSAKITQHEIAILETYLVSLGDFNISQGQQELYEKTYQSWNPKRSLNFKVSCIEWDRIS